VIVAVLALSECGRIEEDPSDAPTTTASAVVFDVYVGGITETDTGFWPCCWRNGDRVDLVDVAVMNLDGLTGDMAVSGQDVYLAGAIRAAGGRTCHPCYWKNRRRIDLSELDPKPERAWNESIAQLAVGLEVVGSDVYVSGNTTSRNSKAVACYWRNGVRYDLSGASAGASSFATDITFGRRSINVSGHVFKKNEGYFKPCYWKNGVMTELSDRGNVNSIIVVAR
jgi:hypothetical protein